MKIPDDKLEELKNIKVPEEKIEELMKECAVDNSRLEELIKEMDEGLIDPKKREEFFELFKKSNLHMPVILGDDIVCLKIKTRGDYCIASFTTSNFRTRISKFH